MSLLFDKATKAKSALLADLAHPRYRWTMSYKKTGFDRRSPRHGSDVIWEESQRVRLKRKEHNQKTEKKKRRTANQRSVGAIDKSLGNSVERARRVPMCTIVQNSVLQCLYVGYRIWRSDSRFLSGPWNWFCVGIPREYRESGPLNAQCVRVTLCICTVKTVTQCWRITA